MRRTIGSLIMALVLAACTVTVSDAPAATPTPDAPPPTATEAVVESAESEATPEAVDANSASEVESSLEGRLIFADDFRGVMIYDFATGEISTLFEPPDKAVTRTLSASPDGSVVVVQYAPPPEGDGLQFGFTSLHIMPTDGSGELTPLLEGVEGEEIYYLPSWSPDGAYLYYSHIVPNPDEEGSSRRQLERIAYPIGEPEVLVINGFSPRLSSDGTKMVYALYDPDKQRDEVVVSNLDGSDPVVLLENNLFSAIDAPIFTPDSEQVLFSAVTSDQARSNYQPSIIAYLLDRLMGVQVAKAHAVPSDIWSVPSDGGRARQITSIYEVNLWPDFSPDGEKMALLSTQHIYVMDPDGSNVETILSEGASGTMSWIP